MIPLRISLEGFMCYREKQCIDFNGSSLWILWGENAVGKSAVFDAITYALYNEYRGGKSNHKDLINHDANKLCVEFDFLLGNVAYRIRRTCARSGSPTRAIYLLDESSSDGSRGPAIIPIADTETVQGFEEWVRRMIGFTYTTFTSSVLLLQGKNEKLLDVTPQGRFVLLSELIDLSRYERIAKAADQKRGETKVTLDNLETRLQQLPEVTDEQVSVLKAELEQKDAEWVQKGTEIEDLTTMLERVRQRMRLLQQKVEEEQILQDILGLLEQEQEIKERYAEWEDLEQVLPSIEKIEEQRRQLREKEQHIMSLENDVQVLDTLIRGLKQSEGVMREQVDGYGEELRQIQEQKEECLKQQKDLAPLVERIEQIENAQKSVLDSEKKLADFRKDIEQAVADAEQRLRALDEASQALPWLKKVARWRQDLNKALLDERLAQEELEKLSVQLQEAGQTLEALDEELKSAQQEERQLFELSAQAKQKYKATQERLERFEDVATKHVCELCGQIIDQQHAHNERKRLQGQQHLEKEQFDTITRQQEEAKKVLLSLEDARDAVQEESKSLTGLFRDNENSRMHAHTQVGQYLTQLSEAYAALPALYQRCISDNQSVNDIDWQETEYPSPTDLQEIDLLAKQKIAHESHLKQLREDCEQWRCVHMEKTLLEAQLKRLLNMTNLEQAREARTCMLTLEKDYTDLQDDEKRIDRLLEQVDLRLGGVHHNLLQTETCFQTYREDLKGERATVDEKNRLVQALLTTLTTAWQERAVTLDVQGLEELRCRHVELVEYESLYDQLGEAQQSRENCKQRIDELEKHITREYKEEAMYSEDSVQESLKTKKAARQQLADERNSKQVQLALLEGQQKTRSELLDQKREAERRLRVYKLLADLLGRNGLQRNLMNDAEKMIVMYANQTLYNLSHGRMRLELKKDSQRAAPNKIDKALDLVVYDEATGNQPISVDMVSGSQKFRIAISLAMAIGKHTRGNGRGVESVIIDEGFGSLDKAGRDDMILELSQLSQVLSRVIVVSHQEEIASAFSNRYSFELVDGSTQVSFMLSDE